VCVSGVAWTVRWRYCGFSDVILYRHVYTCIEEFTIYFVITFRVINSNLRVNDAL